MFNSELDSTSGREDCTSAWHQRAFVDWKPLSINWKYDSHQRKVDTTPATTKIIVSSLMALTCHCFVVATVIPSDFTLRLPRFARPWTILTGDAPCQECRFGSSKWGPTTINVESCGRLLLLRCWPKLKGLRVGDEKMETSSCCCFHASPYDRSAAGSSELRTTNAFGQKWSFLVWFDGLI